MRPSSLDPERYRQIDAVFDRALGLPPEGRATYLDRACAQDPDLRAEVEALLEAHRTAGSRFEESVGSSIAEVIAAQEVSGRRIGPFRLEREIGRGGMGVVYLAEDTRLGRKVALKMLPSYLAVDLEAKKRFVVEARAVSTLDHPNVATLHEADETEHGQLYMAFAFYEGETLDRRISRGPMPPDEAIEIVVGITQGLAAAHGAGIVHRDVKPSNILLTKAGRVVKLLDFGVAKMVDEHTELGGAMARPGDDAGPDPAPRESGAGGSGGDDAGPDPASRPSGAGGGGGGDTSPGPATRPSGEGRGGGDHATARRTHRRGTIAYMSPEQATGSEVDERTDLWSLGVVFYEMLTAHRPFDGKDQREVISAIVDHRPDPPRSRSAGVPDVLDRIVSRLLSKDSRDRYQTAEDLLIDLQSLRRGDLAGAAGPAARTVSNMAFRRTLVGAAVVVMALFGAVSWLGPDGGAESDGTVAASLAMEDLNADSLLALGRVFGQRQDPAGLALAESYFERAIEIDSSFAPARAALAEALVQMGDWGYARPSETFDRARQLAETALRMDSTLAEAEAALSGVAFFYDWDWATSERHARRAIAFDESHAWSHRRLAQSLAIRGIALEEPRPSQRANELERLPALSDMGPAFGGFFTRDFDHAIERARVARDFDAGLWQAHWLICMSLTRKESHEEALTECEAAAATFGRNPMIVAALAFAYATSGRRGDAERTLSGLENLADEVYVRPTLHALVYGQLGDLDRAFEWLERAYLERDALLVKLYTALFDGLRTDARFDALSRRLGLAP